MPDPVNAGASPLRYTRTAIALHWVMALAILCSFSVGLYMVDLPLSPHKLKTYSWHKWAGVTIFLLALARIAWRLRHPAPALPASMPRWQQALAGALHLLLYILIVLIPIVGWLGSSASGFQTVYFGLLPIPDLLAKDKPVGEALLWLHGFLNYFLAGVVGLHVAAALKHHWVDRDEVLARMLPALRR